MRKRRKTSAKQEPENAVTSINTFSFSVKSRWNPTGREHCICAHVGVDPKRRAAERFEHRLESLMLRLRPDVLFDKWIFTLPDTVGGKERYEFVSVPKIVYLMSLTARNPDKGLDIFPGAHFE